MSFIAMIVGWAAMAQRVLGNGPSSSSSQSSCPTGAGVAQDTISILQETGVFKISFASLTSVFNNYISTGCISYASGYTATGTNACSETEVTYV